MFALSKKIVGLFKGHERRNLYFLTLFLLISGLLEALSLGLIFPYVGIATEPDFLKNNDQLSFISDFVSEFGMEDHLLIYLGSLLISLFIVKFFMVLWLTKLQYNIIYRNQVNIGQHLLRSYLSQPFEFFIKNNSANLIRNITIDTAQIANGVLVGITTILSEGFIVLGLVAILLFVNPLTVLILILSLSFVLGIVYYFTKNYMVKKGAEVRDIIGEMIKLINESFGNLKDVKILKVENFFVAKYQSLGVHYTNAYSGLITVGKLPRLILELLIVSAIAITIGVYSLSEGSISKDFLPTIALFGTIAVRLMPSLNRIATGFNGIKQHQAALDNIVKELSDTPPIDLVPLENSTSLKNGIELRDIWYKYEGNDECTLKGINLKVKKGEFIGIVGKSGAGKSTLLEIILGLLPIERGLYLVDDQPTDLSPGMKGLYGYVQQSIYVSDSSVDENVALGKDIGLIDSQKITQSLKQAELLDWYNDLSKAQKGRLGEKGTTMSGGQRQRLGIARAIYNDPEILVLDESTSALDKETENRVLGSLTKLKQSKTMIMVAHNLETLRNCDRIVLIDDGEIQFDGGYNDFLRSEQSANR